MAGQPDPDEIVVNEGINVLHFSSDMYGQMSNQLTGNQLLVEDFKDRRAWITQMMTENTTNERYALIGLAHIQSMQVF